MTRRRATHQHTWDDPPPGTKRTCALCGVVDGGPRLKRPDPDPAVTQECPHRYGHNWATLLDELARVCTRCGLKMPQGASGRKRMARVARLGARDGWQCFYCRTPFSADVPITEDHRTPRSLGGTRALANLVLACPQCNAAKADGSEKQLRERPGFQARLARAQRLHPERVDEHPAGLRLHSGHPEGRGLRYTLAEVWPTDAEAGTG